MCRCVRRALPKANDRSVTAAARPDRPDQMYWQGIQQPGECRRGFRALREKCLYLVRRSRRTEWIVKIQPTLKKAKLEVLLEACGKRLCRREIIELRAGRKKPHRGTEKLLAEILKKLGLL